MNRLDPEYAAYYSIIAICLVLIGAILTPGSVGINERGALLGGIAAALFLVAYRFRRRRPPDE